MLLDRPFADIHHEGVHGLFDEKRADEIVDVVRSVKENARVKIG